MAPLVLAVRVTLADQVQLNEWLLDQPALRRRRVGLWLATIVLVPVLGLMLGIGVATLQFGTPFLGALADAMDDRGNRIIVGFMAGAMALLWGGQRLLRRPLLRRRLRLLLPERPGVDPADPALTERARLVLDEDGFTSETAASTARVPWATVKGLGDAGTLFVLRTGRFSGYIVPKRDLSPDDEAALRAMVARAGR